MAHPFKPFPSLSDEVRADLQKLAADAPDERMAVRARIILESGNGKSITRIAEELSERPNTVADWRQRFIDSGISGLKNLPRGSSRSLSGDQFTQRLTRTLHTCPPGGEKYWTGPLLAQSLGVSENTIRKYLTNAGIRLKELRSNSLFQQEDTDSSTGADDTTASGEPACTSRKADAGNTGRSVSGGEVPMSDEIDEVLSAGMVPGEKEPEVTAGEDKKDDMLDLVFVAQYVRKDGTVVVSSTVTVPDAAPDLESFDISTASGFREDFAHVETSAIEGNSRATTGVVGLYLTEASKKNVRRRPE